MELGALFIPLLLQLISHTLAGPCNVDGPSSTRPNPYSWTNTANVLFLDQPIGVGFSYSDDDTVVVSPASMSWTWLKSSCPVDDRGSCERCRRVRLYPLGVLLAVPEPAVLHCRRVLRRMCLPRLELNSAKRRVGPLYSHIRLGYLEQQQEVARGWHVAGQPSLRHYRQWR
jgi:hypothetical protein